MDSSELPRWALQMQNPPKPRSNKSPPLRDPPGYSSSQSSKRTQSSKSQPQSQPRKPPTPEETDTLKLKKSWEIALAPVKSLPMNAIMMYMSGNSLQIFSIMMVFMLLKNPIMALTQTVTAFRRFETEGNRGRLLWVRVVYVLTNLLALGLGVWKVGGMGLLPTTRSDWLAWETERVERERTVFAL